VPGELSASITVTTWEGPRDCLGTDSAQTGAHVCLSLRKTFAVSHGALEFCGNYACP